MKRLIAALGSVVLLAACGGTGSAPTSSQPAAAGQSAAGTVSSTAAAASAKPAAGSSSAESKPAAASAKPAASTAAAASGAKTVEVGTFPQAYINWPILAADKQGFFAAQGIKVDTKEIPQSSTLLQGLTTGQLNVVMTTPDTSMITVNSGAPVIYIAVNQKPTTIDLVVTSKINSFADLKGKTLGVGQRDSTYALLAERMLLANGLKSSDYQFFSVASEPDRYASMQSGKLDGAFVGPPRNFQAVTDGFHSLGLVAQYLQHDEFNGFVVNTPWATQNRSTVVGFLRAVSQADKWLADPANRDSAIDQFQGYVKLDRGLAVQSYDLMITKLHAFPPDMKIDPAAHQEWIDSFVERGVFTKPAPPLSKFIDESYLQEALNAK